MDKFLTIWCSMNLWWGWGGGGERSGAQAKQSSHTGVKEKDEIVSYTSSHMSQGYSFKDRCTCNKRMFFCRAL